MTTIRSALAAPDLAPELRSALEGLLLSMADDEFVIGFSDSEWTGIAPMLEEDVAMSSLAQDELGHAQALYQLLASLRGHPAAERPARVGHHVRQVAVDHALRQVDPVGGDDLVDQVLVCLPLELLLDLFLEVLPDLRPCVVDRHEAADLGGERGVERWQLTLPNL